MRLLIAGCGYLGSELLRVTRASGLAAVPLRRTAGHIDGVSILAIDLSGDYSIDEPFTHVVYALSPKLRDAAVYDLAFRVWQLRLLAKVPTATRWIMVSSTAVYAENGSPIDENGALVQDGTAAALVHAESTIREACAVRGCEFSAARLSGIYGVDRRSLLASVAKDWSPDKPGNPDKPGTGNPDVGFGNRIHLEDAARVLAHLLGVQSPSAHYNVSDQTPALMSEVRAWMRAELASRPGLLARIASESPRSRSPGTQKRIDSSRLVQSGFVFRYPSYKEGYARIIEELEAEECNP